MVFAIFVILAKTRKWPKIHFFFWEVEFFLHTLIIWGDLHFSVFTFLIWSKKVGENGKKSLLCTSHFFSFFPFLPTFLTKWKSVLHEKCSSSQMIKVCQQKFPLFKIKKGFLAIFVILAKTQKWPKINFFFLKVEIFFAHKIQLGRPMFFSFYIFDLVKKSGRKWKKYTFVKGPFLQLFPIFAYFFWPNQKVYYMKNVGLPKWLRCAKKISTFQNKKMVFWPFLWFWPKHENGQKSIFSFGKWNFFCTP